MVRLEVLNQMLLFSGLSLFQFQYGAIRRGMKETLSQSFLPCFNSSMVRLEAAFAKSRTLTFLFGFNSSMVRLEAVLAVAVPALICTSFNSSMVRLEELSIL